MEHTISSGGNLGHLIQNGYFPYSKMKKYKTPILGSGALKMVKQKFDYSGTQAIKALKEEGKNVILVNPMLRRFRRRRACR